MYIDSFSRNLEISQFIFLYIFFILEAMIPLFILYCYVPAAEFVRCSVRAEVRHLRKVLCHRLNVEKHQV